MFRFGNIQNDIIKPFHWRKNFVWPKKPNTSGNTSRNRSHNTSWNRSRNCSWNQSRNQSGNFKLPKLAGQRLNLLWINIQLWSSSTAPYEGSFTQRRPFISRLEEIRMSILANIGFTVTAAMIVGGVLHYQKVDLTKSDQFPNDIYLYCFHHVIPQCTALIFMAFHYIRYRREIIVFFKRNFNC